MSVAAFVLALLALMGVGLDFMLGVGAARKAIEAREEVSGMAEEMSRMFDHMNKYSEANSKMHGVLHDGLSGVHARVDDISIRMGDAN